MKFGALAFWIGIVFLVVVALGLSLFAKSAPGNLDSLATCIANQGVKFYGAFWCPHCQATKALFGNSARLLPYVECSNPDMRTQTQVCIDKGITTYPTWIRSDGASTTGEHTLRQWADFSGCTLDGKPVTALNAISTSAGSQAHY